MAQPPQPQPPVCAASPIVPIPLYSLAIAFHTQSTSCLTVVSDWFTYISASILAHPFIVHSKLQEPLREATIPANIFNPPVTSPLPTSSEASCTVHTIEAERVQLPMSEASIDVIRFTFDVRLEVPSNVPSIFIQFDCEPLTVHSQEMSVYVASPPHFWAKT